MNKYAVEKKYFNFSTREQWLWDELVIPVPANKTITSDLLDQLKQLVATETRGDIESAEASWRELALAHDLHQRRGTPTAVVRTSAAGLEVVVRYVTKAPRRFDTAVHLRQAVLATLGLGTSVVSGPSPS